MEDKGRYELSRVWGTGIRNGPVDLVGDGGGRVKNCKKEMQRPKRALKKLHTQLCEKKIAKQSTHAPVHINERHI